ADEQHPFAKVGQRRQDLAELHALAFALGPPLLAVKAVPGEEDGEANGGLAGASVGARLVAPDGQRFEPRQRHRDAEATQYRAAGQQVVVHGKLPGSVHSSETASRPRISRNCRLRTIGSTAAVKRYS